MCFLRSGRIARSTIGGVSESTPPVRPSSAATAADRVASIVGAAEDAARRMLEQTEERVRERIAEGDRAAENRVRAAEEEAQEILAQARAEASKAVGDATGEALAIMARAQENADTVMSEARQSATKEEEEIKERARELLFDARTTASDARSEGLEVAANLRDMGDSLRSNAERLLRDVQRIHSQLLARLDRIDAGPGQAPAPRRSPGAEPPADNGEVLDVPEFIPPA